MRSRNREQSATQWHSRAAVRQWLENLSRLSDRLVRGWWPLIALVVGLYGAMLAGVRPTEANKTPSPGGSPETTPAVVRIRAATPDEARRLVERGIDLLEARDGADLFALVSPVEQAALLADGWEVRVAEEQTAHLRGVDPQTVLGGYRTVEETEAFLRAMAERYPDLATLIDFGDSWERQQSAGVAGYDLLALRLTNKATPGPKPIFFLLAAIHARELTTAEVATRFISHLLTRYGDDPDVTWILNEHEIVVVPVANPDGRKLAEQGYLQRKNTNDRAGGDCSVPPQSWNHFGVDLNRNFAFAWGTVHGPELSPCSQVYPGHQAASEPETRALQDFIRELYPTRSRPVQAEEGGADNTGVLISLHSFSDLVLWPWGHSTERAPHAEALERLGYRLAEFNGYSPMQSIYLYPTSGVTEDWSYAELGIASYTFEIGPFSGPCGGFMPPYGCLDGSGNRNFWAENLPALLYAARVARAPYVQPAGPEVQHIRVTAGMNGFTVTATMDGGDHPITTAELYIETSPWHGGTPIALSPVDEAYDTPIEQGRLLLPFESDLFENVRNPGDQMLLLVRARNAAGTWGPISAAWMEVHYQTWLPFVSSS